MQKSVTFAKKNFKINIWKIRDIEKLEITVIIQGNMEVLHITYLWLSFYLKRVSRRI